MTWKFPHYQIDKPLNWGKIEGEYSWFRDMKEVPQDAIWHAEGDVHTHTKMVVEALLLLDEFAELTEQVKHILLTAALLHDVEKRSTTSTEVIDGVERIVSPGHAKKGEYTARKFLYTSLAVPFAVREQITKLVRLHGLPLWTIEKPDPRKAVIAASLVVNTKHLSLLARADMLGRICRDKEEMLLRIELFDELCRENDCFGKAYEFTSPYGRYLYLNKIDISPDYDPYDDLKFEVFMMCAIAGSGKDTYIKKHFDLPILSLDEIRRAHGIKPTDKKKNGQVIQMGKEKAREYMRIKKSFVFNATNISRDMRGRWVSLFAEYGARVKIIYLEVPYRQLLLQNNNRKHKVPEKILDKMINKLDIPEPDEVHELLFKVG